MTTRAAVWGENVDEVNRMTPVQSNQQPIRERDLEGS